DSSRTKMEEIVKQLNEVAKSDEPIEVRQAKVARMIQEFNKKNPELALEPVDRESKGSQTIDNTELVSDQMAAVVVELHKEAYALEHPDGQVEQLASRGTSREMNCLMEYCTQPDKKFSCANQNNPLVGYCV